VQSRFLDAEDVLVSTTVVRWPPTEQVQLRGLKAMTHLAIVETPQKPNRSLGRMNTGGLGRNPTTDTRIFNPSTGYRSSAKSMI